MTLFRKNTKVFDSLLYEVSDSDLEEQLRNFSAERTPDVGGNIYYPLNSVGDSTVDIK